MSYSKIHKDSLTTASSDLDLFSTPSTKTSVLSTERVTIGPTRNPDAAQIEFEHRTGDDVYIVPSSIVIRVVLRVLTIAGLVLDANTDNITAIPIQNFLHSIFSGVRFTINGRDLMNEPNYSFVAYVENLLSYDAKTRKTFGRTFHWIEDGSGVLDTADVANATPADVTFRKSLIAGSRQIEMIGRLNIPFLSQDRYLSPGNTFRLCLTKADPSFCMVRTEAGADQYKLDFQTCELMMDQVKVHPGIVSAHQRLHMSGHTLKYPINTTASQSFTIPRDHRDARVNLMINQQKPMRIFIGFLNHNARNGTYDTSPFKFQHFGLKSIGLDIDGRPVPNKPIEMNFPGKSFTTPYFNLARATGKAFTNSDHGITPEKFAKGYSIFVFDLTPDHCERGGVHLIRNCSITLNLSFDGELTETISVFMLAERDDLVEIDEQRTVGTLSHL